MARGVVLNLRLEIFESKTVVTLPIDQTQIDDVLNADTDFEQ